MPAVTTTNQRYISTMSNPFTPAFIAMARAAEEIQAMRPPFQDGDAMIDAEFGEIIFAGHVRADDDGLYSVRSEVEIEKPDAWIPRLDQLLGMLGDPFNGFLDRVIGGAIELGHYEPRLHDWHELALAVVMKERFGKTWDGKGWVKV